MKKKKYWLAIVWILALTPFLSGQVQGYSAAEIAKTQIQERSIADVAKRSLDAVVLIVVSDDSGKERQGSGFIITPDGKIVTNFHVINGARSAVAKLANGAFFPVDGVLASDSDRDLAVLKVPGRNLPFLVTADSDKLDVGERVLAIGSPLGLQNTVSDGIVSAIRDEEPGKTWIQTTTPVSPGNSGGPLLTMDGAVVGVVTWGVRIGQNLNFAAPSNAIAKLLLSSSSSPSLFGSQPTKAENYDGVWTSMVSGRDYKVRFDGDYIYSEWVNLPSQLQGTMAFARSEMKRTGAIWTGTATAYLPCQFRDRWQNTTVTRWVKLETSTEIDKVTPTRIEGRSQGYPDGVDCKKGQYKGTPQWLPFTWIPKQ